MYTLYPIKAALGWWALPCFLLLIAGCKNEPTPSSMPVGVQNEPVPANHAKQPKDNLLINQDLKPEQDSRSKLQLTFLEAEPGRTPPEIIVYRPGIPAIDWQALTPQQLRPKSEANPHGMDPEKMSFGDFGLAEYSYRRANDLLANDDHFYYAIAHHDLLPLTLDSVSIQITYYRDRGPTYSGYFLGYGRWPGEDIAFVIQSNQKGLPEKVNYDYLSEENMVISNAGNDYENFILQLRWKDRNYTGNSNESEILPAQSFVMQIREYENFLLTTWRDDGRGQQCEKYYKIFTLQGHELILRKENNYGCDP